MEWTAAELVRRRAVWHAMADLFLDTETRWSLPHVAKALWISRYGASELDAIFRFEVVPECVWNLYAVAGEWAVMPLDEARLARRAQKPPGSIARLLLRATMPPSLRGEWRAVQRLRTRIEVLEEPVRDGLVRVWGALAHGYLEEGLDDMVSVDSQIAALRDSGLGRARCVEALRVDIEPLYFPLLSPSEREAAPARRACAEALIARAFDR